MHLVLAYDIVDDARRTRLFKRLKAFLRPVQKSVFEGPLPTQRYALLVETVQRSIDPEEDTVRIYHLCRGCRALGEILGTGTFVPEEAEDLVV